LKQFALKNHNPIALYYHYKSMCKNNYLKYIKSGQNITYKRYLYAYRGLINAKYVVHKNKIPPIIFTKAIQDMENILPKFITDKLNKIINLKSQGKEKDIIQNIVKMDAYLEKFLKDDSEVSERSSDDAQKQVSDTPEAEKQRNIDDLNKELRKIVLK